MSVSRRRIRALAGKELREYRRTGSIVATMTIIPLVFLIQPLVSVLTLSSAAGAQLSHRNPLLYMLAIPALVPATLAAYSVVGEREQGTLEPVLGTPIRREELVLGKALAVLIPAVAVSHGEQAAPEVTRALVSAGADVLSIGESQHSLEDVYLELIHEDQEVSRR